MSVGGVGAENTLGTYYQRDRSQEVESEIQGITVPDKPTKVTVQFHNKKGEIREFTLKTEGKPLGFWKRVKLWCKTEGTPWKTLSSQLRQIANEKAKEVQLAGYQEKLHQVLEKVFPGYRARDSIDSVLESNLDNINPEVLQRIQRTAEQLIQKIRFIGNRNAALYEATQQDIQFIENSIGSRIRQFHEHLSLKEVFIENVRAINHQASRLTHATALVGASQLSELETAFTTANDSFERLQTAVDHSPLHTRKGEFRQTSQEGQRSYINTMIRLFQSGRIIEDGQEYGEKVQSLISHIYDSYLPTEEKREKLLELSKILGARKETVEQGLRQIDQERELLRSLEHELDEMGKDSKIQQHMHLKESIALGIQNSTIFRGEESGSGNQIINFHLLCSFLSEGLDLLKEMQASVPENRVLKDKVQHFLFKLGIYGQGDRQDSKIVIYFVLQYLHEKIYLKNKEGIDGYQQLHQFKSFISQHHFATKATDLYHEMPKMYQQALLEGPHYQAFKKIFSLDHLGYGRHLNEEIEIDRYFLPRIEGFEITSDRISLNDLLSLKRELSPQGFAKLHEAIIKTYFNKLISEINHIPEGYYTQQGLKQILVQSFNRILPLAFQNNDKEEIISLLKAHISLRRDKASYQKRNFHIFLGELRTLCNQEGYFNSAPNPRNYQKDKHLFDLKSSFFGKNSFKTKLDALIQKYNTPEKLEYNPEVLYWVRKHKDMTTETLEEICHVAHIEDKALANIDIDTLGSPFQSAKHMEHKLREIEEKKQALERARQEHHIPGENLEQLTENIRNMEYHLENIRLKIDQLGFELSSSSSSSLSELERASSPSSTS